MLYFILYYYLLVCIILLFFLHRYCTFLQMLGRNFSFRSVKTEHPRTKTFPDCASFDRMSWNTRRYGWDQTRRPDRARSQPLRKSKSAGHFANTRARERVARPHEYVRTRTEKRVADVRVNPSASVALAPSSLAATYPSVLSDYSTAPASADTGLNILNVTVVKTDESYINYIVVLPATHTRIHVRFQYAKSVCHARQVALRHEASCAILAGLDFLFNLRSENTSGSTEYCHRLNLIDQLLNASISLEF